MYFLCALCVSVVKSFTYSRFIRVPSRFRFVAAAPLKAKIAAPHS
jgi:hypothetical protein